MKQLIFSSLCFIAALSAAASAPCDAYLFVYFEGSGVPELQEHLRMAVSDDAVNWKALNNNLPVVNSDSISLSGGIRDPHILRAEDGNGFLMVATDMNTARYGWDDPNPGIVLMKSSNLTDWTHASLNLKEQFPENFGDAFWVWAPQTIYDPAVGKYLIYFTLRRENDKRLLTYGAYANSDFTGFEKEPFLIFETPNGCIDNDIILGNDGLYHMFFKGNTVDASGNEIQNGIRQAVGKSPIGPWTEIDGYVDPYAGSTSVEGSGIFPLKNGEGYVLMYDIYKLGKYEYLTTTNLYDFSSPRQFTKNFAPRHGTVMPITAAELSTLTQKFPSK